MHCFSSRVTSWLTRTLRVGGFVLRRRIGASVIRPLHLGWPTQQQRRAQEAVAVLESQTIPWDRHRQIKGKFCTVVGRVISPCLSNIYLHHVLDEWFEHTVRPRLKGRASLVRYADDLVMAFETFPDATRVLAVLGKRLARQASCPASVLPGMGSRSIPTRRASST